MNSRLALFLLPALVAVVSATCKDPKVKADSYTPADSQVLASIPFIAEFSLECSNGEKPALYADVEGTLIPVTQTLDGSKYQVSWTKEVKKARKGESSVSLYDAEGYSALKRSRERGEADSLAPLLTIVVSYPGSYTGPWLNSEHIAAILAILVFYLAFSSKSSLLA